MSLLAKLRKSCYRNDFEIQHKGNVYGLDPTTIGLCLSVLRWAQFLKVKGVIKFHHHYEVITSISCLVSISKVRLHDVNVLFLAPIWSEAFI
jgi:hypothetical protein